MQAYAIAPHLVVILNDDNRVKEVRGVLDVKLEKNKQYAALGRVEDTLRYPEIGDIVALCDSSQKPLGNIGKLVRIGSYFTAQDRFAWYDGAKTLPAGMSPFKNY